MVTAAADQHLDRKVQVLKAIAHPLRLRIVAALAGGDTHVNAMADALEVSQSTVSQQLRILRMSSLVEVHRKDGFSVYSLAEPHLVDLLSCIDRCCASA